jgi:hypothetical protein
MAETDGNRTRLTGMPGHYGFEDRARHQTRNASEATLDSPGSTTGVRWGLGPGVNVTAWG